MNWPNNRCLRRLVLAGVLSLALGAGLPRPVSADLWETLVRGSITEQQVQTYGGDQSGISWRGGVGLGLPASTGGTALQFNAAGPRGCGAANFVTEFTAMFNAQALEDYFVGLIDTAIASAPLVLMCYASPTLCDAYKSFKSIAGQVMQLRAGECQAVERAALDLGDKMRNKQELSCIDEKIAEGKPSWQALDECKIESKDNVLNYALQKVGNFNVVEDALKFVGADDDQKVFAKALLGDVSFRGGIWNTAPPSTPQAAESRWAELYTDYMERLRTALTKVQTGSALTASDTQDISVPGVPVGTQVFKRITVLPGPEQELALQKLAAVLAQARMEYMLEILETQLRTAGSQPADNQARAVLEKRIEELRQAKARLRVLKERADDLATTVAAINAAALAHEQRAWRATQPGFPGGPPSAVYQSGGKPMLGGGIELSE